MEAERKPVFTNAHIFGAIADAAYELQTGIKAAEAQMAQAVHRLNI